MTTSDARVLPAGARARELTIVVVLLGTATAIIVTSEFIAVGLLPAMARDIQISLSEAGRFVACRSHWDCAR